MYLLIAAKASIRQNLINLKTHLWFHKMISKKLLNIDIFNQFNSINAKTAKLKNAHGST